MDPADRAFIECFERGEWPIDRWHHRDHIRIAYLFLMLEPDFEHAMTRMREGIRCHNEAHGIIDTPTMGYHETMTRAWLTLVRLMLDQYGPAASGESFVDERVELHNRKTLRLFYSRDLFMSERAKREWVEPDLSRFPDPAR